MHQSYLKIMKERQNVIEQLHHQLKEFGEIQIFKDNNQKSTQKNGEDDDSKNVKSDDFELEKMRDAVSYKKLMDTISNSRHFARATATVGSTQREGDRENLKDPSSMTVVTDAPGIIQQDKFINF